MALLLRLRARSVRTTKVLRRVVAPGALQRRTLTDRTSRFLNRSTEPPSAGRAPAVPWEELGVPAPPPPPPGTELRNPSSLRTPYDPNRIDLPGDELMDATERERQMWRSQGAEDVKLHVWTRMDEYGNPVPIHFYDQLPKSRKLIQNYDVVIVGGGAGGMAVAAKLSGAGMAHVRKQLDAEGNAHLPENDIRFEYNTLLIEPNDDHYYQPLWTMVGGGKRQLSESTRWNHSLVMGLQSRTHMLQTSVVEFLPKENALITADGRKVIYKQLVVAAGLEVKVDKIKGLRAALGRAGVSSNYVYPYPARTWDFIRFFPGGNALFTVPTGTIKCAGAPQKIMYLAEDYWRRFVGRDLCNIKFVSGLGKLFGVPHYEKTLLAQCKEKGIDDLNFGLNLVEVKPITKEAVFERVLPAPNASVGDRVTLPYDFLHVTPPQGPYEFLARSPLADTNGWVDINKETLQHNRFPNVFALGDCSSAPTSKTAAAAGAQAQVLVENLVRYRESRPLSAKYDGYTACPFVLGNEQSIIAEFDYTGQPKETFPVDGATPSRFLYHIKEEWLPYVYWSRMMRGTHNMDEYRRVLSPLKSFLKPAPQQSQQTAAH